MRLVNGTFCGQPCRRRRRRNPPTNRPKHGLSGDGPKHATRRHSPRAGAPLELPVHRGPRHAPGLLRDANRHRLEGGDVGVNRGKVHAGESRDEDTGFVREEPDDGGEEIAVVGVRHVGRLHVPRAPRPHQREHQQPNRPRRRDASHRVQHHRAKRLRRVSWADGIDRPGEHVEVDESDESAGREGSHELEVVRAVRCAGVGQGRRREAPERHRDARRRQHLKLELAVLPQTVLAHLRSLLDGHLEEAVGAELQGGVVGVGAPDPVVARVRSDGASPSFLRQFSHRAAVAASELDLVHVPHPPVLGGDPHRGGEAEIGRVERHDVLRAAFEPRGAVDADGFAIRLGVDVVVAGNRHLGVAVDALDEPSAVLGDEHDGDAAVARGEPGAALLARLERERVLNDAARVGNGGLGDDVVCRGLGGSRRRARVLHVVEREHSLGNRKVGPPGGHHDAPAGAGSAMDDGDRMFGTNTGGFGPAESRDGRRAPDERRAKHRVFLPGNPKKKPLQKSVGRGSENWLRKPRLSRAREHAR
mmetsp:Transcript_5448/g.22277  ORF Transcript_5448/g.22277 Transcript_5448/m.22277 type:complete len:532 (+) Transcript_5448:905-2500(+)